MERGEDLSQIPSEKGYLETDGSEAQPSLAEAEAMTDLSLATHGAGRLASPSQRAQTRLFALPICIPSPEIEPNQGPRRESWRHAEVLLMCSG